MRVKLGRWNSGGPPSLVIVAETEDDTQILGAIAEGSTTHRMALSTGYNCSPPASGQLPGMVEISLCWFKKEVEPTAMTVEELVQRGVDRQSAEFIHGEQWSDEQMRDLLSSEARKTGHPFEPIGDAAARVVKSLTVGADDTAGSLKPVRERVSDALGGLMARKPTEDK